MGTHQGRSRGARRLPPDLDADDWDQPSLCEGRTVKDVALHMLVMLMMLKGKVIRGFVGSGFNLAKFSQKQIDRMSLSSPPTRSSRRPAKLCRCAERPAWLKSIGVLGRGPHPPRGDISGPRQATHLPVEHYVVAR